MSDKIEVGCTVAYGRQFLRNTGQHVGNVPFMRGVVTAITTFGRAATLATVDWDSGEKYNVLTANLVRADRIHLERA
jgi:hypothetical protein